MESENVIGGSQESAWPKFACHQRDARVIDRNNRQIIRNCKKAINLAFLPNQIEESFVSLQLKNVKISKESSVLYIYKLC